MISNNEFRKMSLAFEDAVELPHFHLTSFRAGKKIFATLDEVNQRAMISLTNEDQSVFCAYDKNIIYPVPNKWGLKGATYFELRTVKKSMVKDALSCAYKRITP